MNDIQLRGQVLNKLYEIRSQRGLKISESMFSPPMLAGELVRICGQLQEHNLVNAKIVDLLSGDPLMVFCNISARGVDVVETGLSPDLNIDLMKNSTINITGSKNVIVGDNNSQNIQQNFQEIIKAIENSNLSLDGKNEAKSILRKMLETPLFNTILGAGLPALIGLL